LNYVQSNSVYINTEVDSPGALYQNIRKIKSMNEMANFILVHIKCIPKYEKIICEVINNLPHTNELHIDLIYQLVKEPIEYCEKISSSNENDSINQYYRNESLFLSSYESTIEHYIKVIQAYAFWFFGDMTNKFKGKPLNLSGLYNVKDNDCLSEDSRYYSIGKEIIIPFLLMLSTPATIDKYWNLYPEYKEAVINFLNPDGLSDKYEILIDHDALVSAIASILPPVSTIMSPNLSNFTLYKRQAEDVICTKLTEKIRDIYTEIESGKEDIEGCIYTVIGNINNTFSGDFEHRMNTIMHMLYCTNNLFTKKKEINVAESLGLKYYGEDAYIVYKEAIRIYTYTVANLELDEYSPKEIISKIVDNLLAYCKVISDVYKVDPKVTKSFVLNALVSLGTNPGTYIHPVISLYEKKAKIDHEPSQESIDFINEEMSLFINNFDEDNDDFYDIEEEEAIESKISRRISRTVGLDKFARRSFNKYKSFRDREGQIDVTLTSWAKALKNLVIGDTRTEIIEGKQYTVLGVLKKIFGIGLVFSTFGKVKGVLALIVRHCLKKKATNKEKKMIIQELDSEIEICEEKIEDAKGDHKRKEKYKLMRIKKELENARAKIRIGMGVPYEAAGLVKDELKQRRRSIRE